MTVVSGNEFVADQEKYFNLALSEQVYIQRGENMFTIGIANDRKKHYLEPDDDFHRAITMDELRKRVKEDIHQWYMERDESNSIARSTAAS